MYLRENFPALLDAGAVYMYPLQRRELCHYCEFSLTIDTVVTIQQ